jgi:acyl-homoserine-lactone acylase
LRSFAIAAAIAVILLPLALLQTGAPAAVATAAPSSSPKAEILWDTYGVPHIFAADADSLFSAFGWAQMEAHGDLILRLYGQARGRAAEYWGEDYLDSDKQVLRAGVPPRSRMWLEKQTPEARRLLDAFVRGMNDYAGHHPEALDPKRRVALPVEATDILAHTQRVIHLVFVAEEETERARDRFRAKSVRRTPGAGSSGSNAWAIAPARSASGKALLVANPHLPWADFFTWFEAHLHAPGVNATGATLVGQNLLGIAFNEHLGWTHTVNTIDAADTYELTLTEGGYRFDGAVRPFETDVHAIKVRQNDGSLREKTFTVKRSVHGTVIEEEPGRALAIRVAGLEQPNLADQYWRMIRSTNLEEFEAALRMLQMPMFTVMYADRNGHVLHLFGGRTPVRPAGGHDWSGTVPGDTSATLWTTTHAYDELPRVVDPPTGWLQNANDPPWTTSFPAVLDPSRFPPYMAPREMGFRPQRSARMLAEDESVTWEELLAHKHDTRMELADRVLDDLAAAIAKHGDETAKAALKVLERWDRSADSASRGGVLFAEWARAVHTDGGLPFAVEWDEKRPTETPDGLSDPKGAAAALSTAARTVRKEHGAADVTWGDVCRLRRDGVDLPGNGGSGELGIFRVTGYRKAKDGRQEAVGGDSYVAVVEFGSPLRARTLVGYGNWSQRGSKHRTDQLALYSRKELKPVWLNRAEVEANLERRETF